MSAVPAYALALSRPELLDALGRTTRDLTNSRACSARLQARLDVAEQALEQMHAIKEGRLR